VTDPLAVLVVEDEPVNRVLLRAVLERSGIERLRDCDIVEAVDLAEARERLLAQRFDVVILDVRLPDGSGLTLAREMAADPQSADQSVIIMSASVLPADRAEAMETGCDAFLAKPFQPSELTDLLTQLIA
jgi:two-component system KDP operon response regulator KdpE